ncbi:ribonuclease HII [Candidatus Parcubacteria bacterium]|nr:ribonuclease HII [Candidatus Parcubacteria bacterium]
MKNPTFSHERALIAEGFHVIVGVDEVGCGALAGPVCAGAVVLPTDSHIGALRDSKLLSPHLRETLYGVIVARAAAWAVGWASVEEIAVRNIRGATLLAMRRAVEQIQEAQFLLVDAWTIPNIAVPQRGIVRGDRTVKSIAAASILAKVTRDRLMRDCHEQYPLYGFDEHKGYGTQNHRRAIALYGPCAIHRKGWGPIGTH